jgi:uncharacterized protein
MQTTAAPLAAPPALDTAPRARFAFGGPLGERLCANERNWLMTAPSANPAMLGIFRDRDRKPQRDLVPWAGEFAGKYLTSAVPALRMARGRGLRQHLARFVAELVQTQRADGYIGPFPAEEGMMGPGRWDLWGQYHVMLGLLLWHRETGDRAAMDAALRCADHFCSVFLDGTAHVADAGSEEMNESCAHAFALLYEQTGADRYLRMLREVEADWERPPSGDYVRTALAGTPFWQTPKPRWEGLHCVQAVAELFFITGDQRYRRAYDQIWWSILEGDRHNTGGFSSGEQATGNPYDPRAIETCCTIAWMAITLDYLRMTGDARAADELELATWNAVLGSQSASGRWWTYNTPMDGDRKASAHEIDFQARAGSSELNCCSVNGPRGLGFLADWAVMAAPDGLALNHYGPGAIQARTPRGAAARLTQQTDYPLGGSVILTVEVPREEHFVLRLRMPGWSRRTVVSLNGAELRAAPPGTYLEIDRPWGPSSSLSLQFDMGPRLWVGEREAAGMVSVYRGPVLLAYDPRFDSYPPGDLPALDAQRLAEAMEVPTAHASGTDAPILLTGVPTVGGGSAALCDFASAGAAGNPYRTWLPCAGPRPAPFGRDNPLRTVWPRG